MKVCLDCKCGYKAVFSGNPKEIIPKVKIKKAEHKGHGIKEYGS